MSVVIQSYTDKSFVVRGDSKPIKDELLKLGGKWNPGLSGGPAWVFASNSLEQVKTVVNKYNSSSSSSSSNSYNEPLPTSRKRTYNTSSNSGNNSEVVLSRKEYLQLLSRIERIEQELKLKSINEDVSKLISNISPNISIQDDDEDSVEDDEDSNDEYNNSSSGRKVQPLLRRNNKNN